MTGETEVEKEVTMVGYDADKNYGGVRQFVSSLCSTDLMERTKSSHRDVSIEFNLGKEHRDVSKSLSSLDYEDDELERLKEMSDGDILKVVDNTRVAESYQYSMNTGLGQFVERIAEELPDIIEAEGEEMHVDEGHYRRTRWQTEDGRCSFVLKRYKAEERRILSKEGKRESDDMYETMAQVPSVSFKVVMKADDDAVIDALSENVIPTLHKAIAKESSIGKVRYTSCQRQQRVKGECYNI